MTEGVRKATHDDSDKLLHCLVRAFDDDPVANYLFRQDSGRNRGFRIFFRFCLCTLSLPRDEVYTTDACRGGALWFPPDALDTPLIQQLIFLPKMIRVAGFRGIGRALKIFEALDRAHPKERHYYLQILGVDPGHQGKGLGSALIRPVLERCDSEGYGAYLENSNEANLAFYERHGFAVTGGIDIGPGAPPVWSMWRDPR